jgi:signal transduction histidine kinase
MIEDMHGSIILLPTQPGKGAAFLIHLPIEKKKILG